MKRPSHGLPVIIAVGIMILLGLALALLPPDSDLIPYAVAALIGLLALLIRLNFTVKQE